MNPNAKKYKPEICERCLQSKTYLLALDRGTAEIVAAIATGIEAKGINFIHPRKEIESTGGLTSNQVGNLSRAHRHGLIAKIKGEPGNWCLTSKGAKFLRGMAVPKYAIVSKVTGHQIGYFETENLLVTVNDLLNSGLRWEGINFDIEEGRIIKDVPVCKEIKIAVNQPKLFV